MTADDLETICDGLASGQSLRAICRANDWAESNVRRWIRDDEQAMAHSARARDLGYDALADQCLEIADEASRDPVAAADKRIRIDTRIRLLGKWSQRYSDKTSHEHSGTVSLSTALDALPVE